MIEEPLIKIERTLTKIEINLPITQMVAYNQILRKLVNFFMFTEGIGGCTYSLPSQPPVLKGLWLKGKGPISKSYFKNNQLVSNLILNNIIELDSVNPSTVYFSGLIKNKEDLQNLLNQLDLDKIEYTKVLEVWDKSVWDIVPDDIIWIYACFDLEQAKMDIYKIIKTIKKIIEKDAGEDLAWITYSPVCIP